MADENESRPNARPAGSPTVRSEPLPPDEAHELVLDLERHGVSSDHIEVETEPPRSVPEVSAVDNATVRRQVRRTLIGSVAGAAVGLALSLIALLVWDSLWWPPTVITATLIGSILGALWSLYGGLEASPEVTDADAGNPTIIETRVVDLDRDKAEDVRHRTDRASE